MPQIILNPYDYGKTRAKVSYNDFNINADGTFDNAVSDYYAPFNKNKHDILYFYFAGHI